MPLLFSLILVISQWYDGLSVRKLKDKSYRAESIAKLADKLDAAILSFHGKRLDW